jgi:chromate reductase, NAD(P)H dehydrogenase (quinone)
MPGDILILGFAGSLRRRSYNRALLRSAVELMPEGARLEIFELEGIPPFNQDLETDMPEKVREFKSRIRGADGILMATPEHNFTISGVLKNAIDWASRPRGDNSFQGKPVALMSASTGMLGGARAQYHLRQAFFYLDMRQVIKPEVFVPFAAQKFDENGRFLDQQARDLIGQLLRSLVGLARRAKEEGTGVPGSGSV